MLNENELLDYHSFLFRVATNPNGSKEIIISASKTAEDPLYTKVVKISASELKYVKFEHNKFLDYAMSAFLFYKKKSEK